MQVFYPWVKLMYILMHTKGMLNAFLRQVGFLLVQLKVDLQKKETFQNYFPSSNSFIG